MRIAMMQMAMTEDMERNLQVSYEAVKEAAGADFLDNHELSMLAIYADNWAKYIRASEAIQREGLTYETAKGNILQTPYVNIADKAAAMIMRCSSKLGLAKTNR